MSKNSDFESQIKVSSFLIFFSTSISSLVKFREGEAKITPLEGRIISTRVELLKFELFPFVFSLCGASLFGFKRDSGYLDTYLSIFFR